MIIDVENGILMLEIITAVLIYLENDSWILQELILKKMMGLSIYFYSILCLFHHRSLSHFISQKETKKRNIIFKYIICSFLHSFTKCPGRSSTLPYPQGNRAIVLQHEFC